VRHRARAWTREHGEDLPEVRDWSWTSDSPSRGASPSTTANASAPTDDN
jgi:xylulose-5-phosphate/fructose-6-phosphate phosphoketolase